MENIAEIMFWAGLVTGLISLAILWLIRRDELHHQVDQQHRLQLQHEELRAEIGDLKAMLRPRDRMSK